MDILNQVITANEAAAKYGKHRITVAQACQKGWVNARKSAGTWLIEKASAQARWGTERKS